MSKKIGVVAALCLSFVACVADGDSPDARLARTAQAVTDGRVTVGFTDSYTATIPSSGDAVDVYFPRARRPAPVVVLLQGANVDKGNYSTWASDIAALGFVVAVPNHSRALGPGMTGLFTSEEVVTQTFEFAVAEGARRESPLRGHVDPQSLAILGHSFGGVAGLFAVQGSCAPPFCTPGKYTRPAALKAAAFWGTNLKAGPGVMPIDTSAAPVALLQGTLDGKALPADGVLTFAQLEAPKAYITFEGANHYGITNANDPAGAAPDPTAPTLDQDTAIVETALFAGLFLRANVLKDPAAAWVLDHIGSSLGGVDVQTVK